MNVRRLAGQIGPGRHKEPELALLPATVASVAADGNTVGLTFDGSTTVVLGVPCLGSYAPLVGDEVQVARVGAAPIVVGSLRPRGRPGQQVGFAESNTATVTTVVGADTMLAVYAQATLVAGRSYSVCGYGRVQTSVAGTTVAVHIRDSGSAANPTTASADVVSYDVYLAVAGGAGGTHVAPERRVVATVSGVHTFGLSVDPVAGTGQATLNGGNSYAWIRVVDCGVP